MTAPSDCDPASLPLAQEARLLVALLRSSRLALLFGEPGADKSAFLQVSLLPLLQRRSGDQQAAARPRDTGVVVPFPDRRQRAGAARRKREVVVLFDDWSGVPLTDLYACLWRAAPPAESTSPAQPQRLTDGIHDLSARFDIHFIVLLDRFEEFLRLPPQRVGVTEFTDALVEALNATQLQASFLLLLNEDARPALVGLRHRIPGFDDFSLKLPGVAAVKPPPIPAPPVEVPAAPVQPVAAAVRVSVRASPASTPPPIKPPSPLRPPIKTQDVYALIEDTLNRTATDNDCEPFQGSQPGALPPAIVKPPPAAPSYSPETATNSTWADEVNAALATPPVAAPRRRRPKPTLIGRCKALLRRLWRPRRETD
jgi:hypothetical protein